MGIAPVGGGGGRFTVAQFNVENFYGPGDSAGSRGRQPGPTAEQYATKLSKLTRALVDQLHAPDVVAMEELGSEQSLRDLAATPELAKLGYRPLQLGTNDGRGIRVGLLYRADRVRLDGAPTQLTPDLPAGMKQPYGQVDRTKLFARPPLVADFTFTGAGQAAAGAQQVQLVVNHWMAKVGGEAGSDPFRNAQADFIGGYVDAQRAADPTRGVIVMGDLNTAYGDGAYGRVTTGADGAPRLVDTPQVGLADPAERYTYEYRGQHDMLDHVLVTPDLAARVAKVEIPHFDTTDWDPATRSRTHVADPSTAAGVSDHDPILTTFELPPAGLAQAAAGAVQLAPAAVPPAA